SGLFAGSRPVDRRAHWQLGRGDGATARPHRHTGLARPVVAGRQTSRLRPGTRRPNRIASWHLALARPARLAGSGRAGTPTGLSGNASPDPQFGRLPALRPRLFCYLNPQPRTSHLAMNTANLETTLKQLRLSGLGQTLSVRLQEAAANRLSHAEFL